MNLEFHAKQLKGARVMATFNLLCKVYSGQKYFNDRKESIRLPNTNEEGYRDKTKDSDST